MPHNNCNVLLSLTSVSHLHSGKRPWDEVDVEIQEIGELYTKNLRKCKNAAIVNVKCQCLLTYRILKINK